MWEIDRSDMEPVVSVAKITLVSVAKTPETDTAEAELETNNKDEKEEKKATDMSVPKTCTEPELNKMNYNQAESILDLEDKYHLGELVP